MFQPYLRLSYLYLLHDQRRYYTSLLTKSHRSLGKQYQRLAEIQLSLAQRHESHMLRREKKHLQWSRSKVKKAIQSLEREHECLEEHLRQCGDVIASYVQTTTTDTPAKWAGYYTQPPYPITPVSTMTTMPRFPSTEDDKEQPKYWDLSMLRERGGSTASVPSADSGFHEPSIFSQPLPHPCVSGSPPAAAMFPSPQPRQNSFQSEDDTVGELEPMPLPAKTGAMRQRRYSENAIQLIESRFAAPKSHNRVRSVEQIPALDRVTSVPGRAWTNSVADV